MENLKIVNIGHYVSRTGTLFLHSLLDNHPAILTIPGVISFKKIIERKIINVEHAFSLFETDNPKFYDTSLLSAFDNNNSGLWQLGENKKEKIFTERKEFKFFFFEYLNNKSLTLKKNIILGIYYAYAKTHGIKLTNKKILLLHPHEKKICIRFKKIFPESKFLIPIRNPIKVYYSIITINKKKSRLINENYYPAGQLIDLAKGLDEFYDNNFDMLIIKFEKLKDSLKEQMIKICKYINIQYEDTLLKSTFGGYKYWGNTFDNPRDRFENSKNSAYENSSERELFFLSKINFKILKRFGYEKELLKRKNNYINYLAFFFPLKDEINFIKSFEIKLSIKYLKFFIFFFLKRIYLLILTINSFLQKNK